MCIRVLKQLPSRADVVHRSVFAGHLITMGRGPSFSRLNGMCPIQSPAIKRYRACAKLRLASRSNRFVVELTAQALGAKELGDRIMKVNHAVEQCAINIYSGQIFMVRLTARPLVNELIEFRSHEERHRALFGAELTEKPKIWPGML